MRSWLSVLRSYLIFIAAANLVWELLQLPLYTIWREGTRREIAFAIAHCTAGDVLIALSCLIAALVVFGAPSWPDARFRPVAMTAIALGVAYTSFSEWLNTEVRASWTYSERMPVVPVLGIGLTPILQWLVLPSLGLLWARRLTAAHRELP